ncbi:MAG: GatB/YqeY domain-containing protein [Anderseniella sp.]|nr:GatB/YqeY domain-containing protein [Anderseniella sp.]
MSDSLKDRVTIELKDAMRGGDKVRLATLRLISAAFKDREIQNRGTGTDESLSEAGMQEILARMIKQRRESAETYEKGGRPELAATEKAEIAIIEEFLPRQLSIAEMEAAVSGVVKELDASGLKDMGRVMGVLKERHAGQMDFAKAGAMVKSLLG